jgi:hypothetical protein
MNIGFTVVAVMDGSFIELPGAGAQKIICSSIERLLFYLQKLYWQVD